MDRGGPGGGFGVILAGNGGRGGFGNLGPRLTGVNPRAPNGCALRVYLRSKRESVGRSLSIDADADSDGDFDVDFDVEADGAGTVTAKLIQFIPAEGDKNASARVHAVNNLSGQRFVGFDAEVKKLGQVQFTLQISLEKPNGDVVMQEIQVKVLVQRFTSDDDSDSDSG